MQMWQEGPNLQLPQWSGPFQRRLETEKYRIDLKMYLNIEKIMMTIRQKGKCFFQLKQLTFPRPTAEDSISIVIVIKVIMQYLDSCSKRVTIVCITLLGEQQQHKIQLCALYEESADESIFRIYSSH